MSERTFRYVMAAIGIACFAAAFGFVGAYKGGFVPDAGVTRVREEIGYDIADTADTNEDDGQVIVQVTGAVMRPGVYSVGPNARVNDAVKKAGGLAPNADHDNINLAMRIRDEDHIHVPEKVKGSGVNEPQRSDEGASGAKDADKPVFSAASVKMQQPSSAKSSGRLDINTCGADELERLPGIGKVLAKAIVTHREKHGPFMSAEQITEVPGIGRKRFEAIRDQITASGR